MDVHLMMRAFERRGLSKGEIALGASVFGGEIAWERLRVAQLPAAGFYAMAPLRHLILYSRLPAWRDFAAAPLAEQGVFVHELAHVWQAAQGVILAFAKLGAIGRGAYCYEARHGAGLAEYNIEAQAEIVRHLFLARAGAAAPGAPTRAWLEDVWARR